MSDDLKTWVEGLTKRTWEVSKVVGNVHGLIVDALKISFEFDDHNVWMDVNSSKYSRPWQGCGFGAFQVEVDGNNQYLLAGVVLAERTRLPILVSAKTNRDGRPYLDFQLGGEALSELSQQDHDGGWQGGPE